MPDEQLEEQQDINADVGQADTPDEAALEEIARQQAQNLAADSNDTSVVDKRTEGG